MKKFVLLISLIGWVHQATLGQTFYSYKKETSYNLLVGIGISKYFGELSDDRRLGDFNPAISIGTEFPLWRKLALRSELLYYRISAADSDLPPEDSRRNRNLSFRSNNIELSAQGVYHIFSQSGSGRNTNQINPYFLGGLGVSSISPQAELDGIWYNLNAMKTEAKSYSKFILVVPIGAGLSYQLNPDLKLALEMNYRFTLSDYLDDVSQTYIDPNSFANPIAAQLSDRRGEIGLENAETGSIRGNALNNDGYFIMLLKIHGSFSNGESPIRRRR